jgi:rfaE bifunctional protein kinase chain/domain
MKIYNLEKLAATVSKLKANGKKIVHCHGVFDLMHIGHIRHFDQARRMGDVLLVTITPDRFVDKGPQRPAFTETLRAEAVASLDSVNFVAINEWPTAQETLRLLRPHIFVKGSEFENTASDLTGKIAQEEKVVKEIGAKLAFTEDIVFSSTNLINRYLSNLPDEIDEYLNLFRKRYRIQDILDVIDRMESLKVLVIGDTIIDEYQYCNPLGKSNKDPALTVHYQSHDIFAGGVLAVANHVAGFTENVKLVTVLGENSSYEDFIRTQISDKIIPNFTFQSGAPTLVKRRYIDGYSFNKLFEVYIMQDSGISIEKDHQLTDKLKTDLSHYDIVIVADYGHGAISDEMVHTVCNGAKFLAVNTQANSGNRGFHTISRYPRADFVCIAEHELRLEMRKKSGQIRPMMEELSRKLKISKLVVTRGRNGCDVANNEEEFVGVPAFAQNVVDRVGAGDCFFSVTALAATQDVPIEVLGFIGNVAGGLAVGVLGNKKSIDKQAVKNYIVSLMK